MAEARRNRTNPSTLPRRNNGFEDRGSHQTPFASIGGSADDNTTRASRMPCQREACAPSPRSTRTFPEKYTRLHREVHAPSPRSTRTLSEKYAHLHRDVHEPSPRSTRTLPEKYTNPLREVRAPSPRGTRTLPEKYTNPPREVHEPSPRRVRTFPEKHAHLPREGREPILEKGAHHPRESCGPNREGWDLSEDGAEPSEDCRSLPVDRCHVAGLSRDSKRVSTRHEMRRKTRFC